MIDGLVSVITPMYNAENTILQTIESVKKQTYENWEMLIVDDCSTDNCVEIVRRYQAEDGRIRLIRNQKNLGVAKTRNVALRNACGQYVAFLDSDDLWRANKLEIQLGLMEKTGTPFCYGMCGVVDIEGKAVCRPRNVPETIDYERLLKGNPIPCLTVLIDRKQIENIEMPDLHHEDYACWLTILKKYGTVACGVQSIIADYRVGGRTLSSNKVKVIGWTWIIYRKYLGLSLGKSLYCFSWYIIRAILKRC